MSQNQIMADSIASNLSTDELEDLFDQVHIGTSYATPLRKDAFDLSDEEKIKIISSSCGHSFGKCAEHARARLRNRRIIADYPRAH